MAKRTSACLLCMALTWSSAVTACEDDSPAPATPGEVRTDATPDGVEETLAPDAGPDAPADVPSDEAAEVPPSDVPPELPPADVPPADAPDDAPAADAPDDAPADVVDDVPTPDVPADIQPPDLPPPDVTADDGGPADATTDGADATDTVEDPDVPSVEGIDELGLLVQLHGQAQGIAFYQELYSTDDKTNIPPPAEPEAGDYFTSLSGIRFFRLDYNDPQAGYSERRRFISDASGTQFHVGLQGSGGNSKLAITTGFDDYPNSGPTTEFINFSDFLEVTPPEAGGWSKGVGRIKISPDASDPRIVYTENNQLKTFHLLDETVTVLGTFSGNGEPVLMQRDGSDLEAGRVILTRAVTPQPGDDCVGRYEYLVVDINTQEMLTTTITGSDGNYALQAEDTIPFGGPEPWFYWPYRTDYATVSVDGSELIFILKKNDECSPSGTYLVDFAGTNKGQVVPSSNHFDFGFFTDSQGVNHPSALYAASAGITNSNFCPGADNFDLCATTWTETFDTSTAEYGLNKTTYLVGAFNNPPYNPARGRQFSATRETRSVFLGGTPSNINYPSGYGYGEYALASTVEGDTGVARLTNSWIYQDEQGPGKEDIEFSIQPESSMSSPNPDGSVDVIIASPWGEYAGPPWGTPAVRLFWARIPKRLSVSDREHVLSTGTPPPGWTP